MKLNEDIQKEEILKDALNGLDTIVVAKQFILQAMEEYANLRLSEQKEKHDKEMEEFVEWLNFSGYIKCKHGWYNNVSDLLARKILTTTELLTKFKNR